MSTLRVRAFHVSARGFKLAALLALTASACESGAPKEAVTPVPAGSAVPTELVPETNVAPPTQLLPEPTAAATAPAPASAPKQGTVTPRSARPRALARPGTNHAFDAAPSGGALAAKPKTSFEAAPDREMNTESYAPITENAFRAVLDEPLSTFSVDVDTASYTNSRRFLDQGQLPPADAIRVEEWVNYFAYTYPAPTDDRPFAVHTEVLGCPWAPAHRLVKIGIKGRSIAHENVPPRNLTFLVDVSGSMSSPDKLPLLKRGLALLVRSLRPEDKISLVAYAGASGLVLEPTSGYRQERILSALDALESGGSTNGGDGIHLAYKVAQGEFIRGGVNRVILATDGDFNVGTTSQGELVRLIEEKRKSGVFLTVLGFGSGNLKDSTMELLADKGNGNYAYVDSLDEARKVLVREAGATLVTIAKDVKLQVEFNPARVQSYKLVGYENRLLAKQDFNDDRKDAGEIGAGHTVTALYEIVPAGAARPGARGVDPLKYQTTGRSRRTGAADELMAVGVRYKLPDGVSSARFATVVRDGGTSLSGASVDARFAAAVANFALLLRAPESVPQSSLESVRRLAEGALGADASGDRRGLLSLIDRARALRDAER